MKKIIFTAIAILFVAVFSSCAGTVSKEGDATTMSDPVVEYTEELVSKNSNGIISDYDHVGAVRHFKYRSHSYIQFDIAGGQCGRGGIIHDPDCRCMKK